MPDVEAAARELALALTVADASGPDDLDAALHSIAAQRPDGMVVSAAIAFWTHRKRIVEFCAQARLPAIYAYREPVVDGGLMSYAASLTDTFRRSASYVARIVRGANPGDLPVEQPTGYDLTVRMATAKVLGIAIPPAIAARITEVL
jgi:putative ABC transport system substrate-binding protein